MKKVEIPQDLKPGSSLYKGYQAYQDFLNMTDQAAQFNENLLMRILKDNKDTEFGRAHDFANIQSAAEYREKIPFSTYKDYEQAIERMVHGEKNILTAYPIVHYATTSGSVDKPKNIPVSQETMEIYKKLTNAISQYAHDHGVRQLKGRPLKSGKKYMTTLIATDQVPDGTTRGPISSALYQEMKPNMHYVLPWPVEISFPEGHELDFKFFRALFALKDTGITSFSAPFIPALVDGFHFIESNWPVLVETIRSGVVPAEIKADPMIREAVEKSLKPDEKRADELQAIFEQGFEEPFVHKVWPDAEYLSAAGGGGFVSYTQKIKRYTGDLPLYYATYASSEAMIGVAQELNKNEYTLLPASGFFEFIPVEDESIVLGPHELEVGKEYEIVVTNLAGLYRYKIGDVIEITGYEGQAPRFRFKYRKNQMISLAGEKSTESQISWVINEFQRISGLHLADYSVYADTKHLPGRYVLLLEPETRIDPEKIPEYRQLLDDLMGHANPSYGAKVRDHILLPMHIEFLQPETYYLWRDIQELNGISQNQMKPVHVIDSPKKEKFFFALIDPDYQLDQ